MRNRGNRKWGYYAKLMLLAALIVGVSAPAVMATTATSPSYQVTETQFGVGSSQQSCSGQYCARASIGDMSAGSSTSTSHTATFGKITSNEPLLEVIIDEGESDLGVLSAERTATKTTIVKIRTYLSDGYVLQILGDPPKYGDHTLSTPSTPTESKLGTEQFAINAVANTTLDIGADPMQVLTDQTNVGLVADNYRTPNMFMYSSGDVIAGSDSQSGRTDYTISMIVNVSGDTPAGHYASDFSAVVIPMY